MVRGVRVRARHRWIDAQYNNACMFVLGVLRPPPPRRRRRRIEKAYKVLGHIDILGDPLSLGKSLSSGVIGFVTKV